MSVLGSSFDQSLPRIIGECFIQDPLGGLFFMCSFFSLTRRDEAIVELIHDRSALTPVVDLKIKISFKWFRHIPQPASAEEECTTAHSAEREDRFE